MNEMCKLLVALQRETRAWWIDRRSMGTKRSALRRLRYHAGTEWLGSQLEQVQSRLAELERGVAALPALTGRIGVLEQLVDEDRRQLQVRTVMDWVEHATVRTTPLVSVVLPTRDRCALLPRAIASVNCQTYPNWELLIVDDGSVDD